VILDPGENVVATFEGQTSDVAEYLAFLRKGAGAVGRGPGAGGAGAGGPGLGAGAASPAAGGGQILPQVTLLEGRALDARELADKVVLVNFWATWCVPCISEIPSFNKLHKEMGAKGLVVVGVATDEEQNPGERAALVRTFLKKHLMDYTVALSSDAAAKQYNIGELLPVTLVFDRAGKQVQRFEGLTSEADLRAAVQKAF